MKNCLLRNERVIEDGGYKDFTCSYLLKGHNELDFSFIRARHEALNERLKQFNVLGNRFRHRLSLYVFCCYAVLNIVELSIEDGEDIFTHDICDVLGTNFSFRNIVGISNCSM